MQARQPARRMNRRYRLTSSIDLKRVRRTGKSVAHPLAVLIAAPTGRPGSRFGVTAGRVVGGAVQRNQAKRRLREALRPLLPRVAPGWDAVLIARPALLDADWLDVQTAIAGLLARAHLMESDDRSA
jgi:ribonuclease P protein component